MLPFCGGYTLSRYEKKWLNRLLAGTETANIRSLPMCSYSIKHSSNSTTKQTHTLVHSTTNIIILFICFWSTNSRVEREGNTNKRIVLQSVFFEIERNQLETFHLSGKISVISSHVICSFRDDWIQWSLHGRLTASGGRIKPTFREPSSKSRFHTPTWLFTLVHLKKAVFKY